MNLFILMSIKYCVPSTQQVLYVLYIYRCYEPFLCCEFLQEADKNCPFFQECRYTHLHLILRGLWIPQDPRDLDEEFLISWEKPQKSL